jgi:signal transduction histidine kinase
MVEGSSAASSAGSVDAADVPAHLEREDPVDGFYRTQADIDGNTYLILSSAEVNGPTNAYFFFHLDALQRELHRLAGILSRAWLAVALLSGLVGLVLARQTLRPVARASQAARSLAEGLLETRLPVEREDEFGAWAVSFNEMADALQEKIEALTAARDRERRFTADVTHELRTPLTGLVGSASMLRAELDTLAPEAKWAAERLLAEVVRMRDLVQELLEISRLEGGHETVSRLLIDSRTFLSSVIRHRSWEERVEIRGEDVGVYTDPRRLERIVFNLLDNALKHGGGHVCVSAVKRNGQVEVAVADRGPGIPAEDLPHVFDRFYKADPSRSGGTGLRPGHCSGERPSSWGHHLRDVRAWTRHNLYADAARRLNGYEAVTRPFPTGPSGRAPWEKGSKRCAAPLVGAGTPQLRLGEGAARRIGLPVSSTRLFRDYVKGSHLMQRTIVLRLDRE